MKMYSVPKKYSLRCYFFANSTETFENISKYHIYSSKGFSHFCTWAIATETISLHDNIQ